MAQTSRSSCAFPSAGGVSRVRLRDTCPTDDQAKRLVALKTTQVEQVVERVSDAVKNLDQVKHGDLVKVSYSAGMAGEEGFAGYARRDRPIRGIRGRAGPEAGGQVTNSVSPVPVSSK